MAFLGVTSAQFAKPSPTKQSLVSETMWRQNISKTFLLTNAPIVKQLSAQKLLRITIWLDTTGKTNKESVNAPFKVTLAMRKIT